MLDEVLGGLNTQEINQAVEFIRSLRDRLGLTVLWIEHVMGAVMQAGMSVGMRSMRARLERFHGSLQIQSAQGATVLEATLQLQTESASAGPAAQPVVSADPPRQ